MIGPSQIQFLTQFTESMTKMCRFRADEGGGYITGVHVTGLNERGTVSEKVILVYPKNPLKLPAVFSQTLWNLFSCCCRILWQHFV